MLYIRSNLFINFISVVTELVSTTTPPVTSEDPLGFLSPEERQFFDLLPPSEQEIILASLTSPRPLDQQEEEEEKQEDSGNTALDNLHNIALELQNLNFSTGNTEIDLLPAPSPRNSEDNAIDLEKSSENTENTVASDTDTTTPAFIAESPSLHNGSSIIRYSPVNIMIYDT